MGKFSDIYKADQYKIYCDMDGVLTDFDKQFTDCVGMSPDKFDKKYNDINSFWSEVDKCGLKFWSEMPWMGGGELLWGFISNMSPIILSAPSKNKNSVIGKRIWVNRELTPMPQLILINAKKKMKYATPNSILIDDKLETIKDWNKAGGIGIHHKSLYKTIRKLKEILY